MHARDAGVADTSGMWHMQCETGQLLDTQHLPSAVMPSPL